VANDLEDDENDEHPHEGDDVVWCNMR
jgi:hypothetical protein